MTPPDAPHTALFIYSEAFAQSEKGRRFHVFARLEDSGQRVIFYTHDMPELPITVWRQHDLPEALATQIEDTFASLKIPLNPEVRAWDSMHYVRSLELQVQGATFYIGWDTSESALADALSPLTSLIAPLVAEMKASLAACAPPFTDDDL
ncbi:hypothetical protein [Prosthecobacter sp.]|uniref:hypothetical protein n=1 Tax=Prosthecobacter sp. TaxID=1965333 RepID=UPI00378363FF